MLNIYLGFFSVKPIISTYVLTALTFYVAPMLSLRFRK